MNYKKSIGVLLVLVLVIVAGSFLSKDKEIDKKVDSTPNEEEMMMASMSVSGEKDFIEKMIPHHQEAIDTAREVLERGGEITEVKNLALAIIDAQEAEIKDMKLWYQDWYGEPYKENGTYREMMRDLSPYSGAELDLVFVEDMIMHHMGAMMMAQQVTAFSERMEMVKLSQDVLVNQREEIILMQQILQENL